jgi:hypothetical protein
MLRSGICQGKMYPFGQALTSFVEKQGFSNVVVLSSTLSPVKRERESNREIPELFAYVNNHLYKKCLAEGVSYYEKHGIRRFGYWLGDSKKSTHQELDELMMAGSAQKLVKAFNKTDIPTQLFVIFTTGGIDFVGGVTYLHFLKSNLSGGVGTVSPLGKVAVHASGEQVHASLFSDTATLKSPCHWKQMVNYF